MALSLGDAGLCIDYMTKAKIFLLSFERKFIKKGRGRGQGPEAHRLVKVGRGAWFFSFPGSCRGTEKRLIET
jgi:hypothetical protein